MHRIKILFGLFLAASLDLSFGIFSAVISSILFERELTVIALFLGLLFAVLPDFDFIFEMILKSKSTGGHKASFFHYPSFWVLVCLSVFYHSSYYGVLISLALLGHIIHDIQEEGPGIAIFAPFSNSRYLWKKDMYGKWGLRILTIKELQGYYSMNAIEWVKKEYLEVKAAPVIGASSLAISITWAILI